MDLCYRSNLGIEVGLQMHLTEIFKVEDESAARNCNDCFENCKRMVSIAFRRMLGKSLQPSQKV